MAAHEERQVYLNHEALRLQNSWIPSIDPAILQSRLIERWLDER